MTDRLEASKLVRSFAQALALRRRDKGKPASQRGRKANGGKATCPNTHPIPVPRLQTNVEFPIPTTRGKPTLSSGKYSTMHADFFNAWDQTRLEHLVDSCINDGPFTATHKKPEECF